MEPYGLEIAPELATLARERLPEWADRIWIGNAADWIPPRPSDVIRSGLDYVPPDNGSDLVNQLLRYCGRLVVGVYNEERDDRRVEGQLVEWGYVIAGRSERDQPDRRLAYRAVWIDA